MTTPQAFLTFAAERPGSFTGPLIAGVIVQALIGGIVVSMSMRFWQRSAGQHVLVKGIVVFVSLAAAAHLAISFYNVWRITVLDFGNWEAVFSVPWPVLIHPAMTGLQAAPVQAFLIWRSFIAMRRKWSILIPLALLLLASNITIIWSTISMFLPIKVVIATISPRKPLPMYFIAAYFLSAGLDILLTAVMMWFLFDIKSQVTTPRARQILRYFLRTLWEAAAPPCACAIAACILYMTVSNQNWWSLFCQNILGMLYVMSLLATLNGREDINHLPMSQPAVATENPSHTIASHFLTTVFTSTFKTEEFGDSRDIRTHRSTILQREVIESRAEHDDASST